MGGGWGGGLYRTLDCRHPNECIKMGSHINISFTVRGEVSSPSGESNRRGPFTSPYKQAKQAHLDSLVTLSLTIIETLKWLSSLPILKQESFWR